MEYLIYIFVKWKRQKLVVLDSIYKIFLVLHNCELKTLDFLYL